MPTLGVEEESQLLDAETHDLRPGTGEVLPEARRSPAGEVEPELQRSPVEIGTHVWRADGRAAVLVGRALLGARPSRRDATVAVRVSDVCLSVDDSVLAAGLARGSC